MRSLDRLTEADRPLVARHLLRLDESDRRLRFCSPLKDSALLTHVDRLDLSRGHHIGYFVNGELRGLTELFAEADQTRCEAALSVDAGWRRKGIGARMLDRTLRLAALAGFQQIDLFICNRNTGMRALARTRGFEIKTVDGEVIATRALRPDLPAHHLGELIDTTQSVSLHMLTAGLAAWSAWSGLIAPLAATAPANHTPTGTAAPESPSLQPPPRGRGVRHRQIGTVAHLTLDRPEKLNALDLDLVHALHDALDRCANDPAVDVVVIDGAGDTAFSAGGDVRAVRAAQLTGEAYGAHFFHELYALTHRIHAFPKPYVALIDGITMGGGLGISMHGSHRVASDRTAAAMPENRIGFFTDVGASYVLPRLPGEIGTYMALTGARLTGADAVQAGLATHLVPVDRIGEIPDLIARALLHRAPWDALDGLLDRLAIASDAATIRQQQPEIDRCFGHDTVEEVLAALQAEDSDWSRHAAGVLAQQCPTSLKVTLKAMRRGARASFGRCMAMEYGICQTLIARPDFAEGVRAQLVDKCRQPAWQPATLAEVSDEVVARCFARRRAVHPEPREGLHAAAGIPAEIGTATATRTKAPLPETA